VTAFLGRLLGSSAAPAASRVLALLLSTPTVPIGCVRERAQQRRLWLSRGSARGPAPTWQSPLAPCTAWTRA